MHRKLTATAAALVAASALALVGAPTPDLRDQAVRATQDANAYEGWKGAGYACSALASTTPEDAVAWLRDSRGYSDRDATELVELAERDGCEL